jgi:hypothetical protein
MEEEEEEEEDDEEEEEIFFSQPSVLGFLKFPGTRVSPTVFLDVRCDDPHAPPKVKERLLSP